MKLPRLPSRDELDNQTCSCGEECCPSPAPAGEATAEEPGSGRPWITGRIATAAGDVPAVATKLSARDRLGGWAVRWSLGRMRFAVPPGLYAAGSPDPSSPVLVTANFKLTFDRLRRAVDGLSAWILVLDTKGINVWCAAGKATFGTEELIRRLDSTGLARVVSHRTLVLPQLGASNLAAHEVARRARFRVVYGPVRARDVRAFLAAGMKATPEMRRVGFGLWDRIILTPIEVVGVLSSKPFLAVAAFWLAGLLGLKIPRIDMAALAGAILAGTVVAPVLLPWIPGRAFAWKGFLAGAVWTAAVLARRGFPPSSFAGWAGAASYVLIFPALSAFLAMNFTGSSTFTSLSGVVKEMRTAVPLMAVSGVLGLAALVVSAVLGS